MKIKKSKSKKVQNSNNKVNKMSLMKRSKFKRFFKDDNPLKLIKILSWLIYILNVFRSSFEILLKFISSLWKVKTAKPFVSSKVKTTRLCRWPVAPLPALRAHLPRYGSWLCSHCWRAAYIGWGKEETQGLASRRLGLLYLIRCFTSSSQSLHVSRLTKYPTNHLTPVFPWPLKLLKLDQLWDRQSKPFAEERRSRWDRAWLSPSAFSLASMTHHLPLLTWLGST